MYKRKSLSKRTSFARLRLAVWAVVGAQALSSSVAAASLIPNAASALTLQPPPDTTSSPTPEPTPDTGRDLTSLSLQSLMDVEVSTASRKLEHASEAPAAVYVISGDDIARYGFSSLPEALRLSPGVNVARQDAAHWAVGVRGFNTLFSNRLLVLFDGRSIYNPFFSGTLWDQHDYLMPDIDRIEVVRGPGGTLWGSNAVDGVINIQTKSSDQTQGWLLTTQAGTSESDAGIRYGGRVDEDTTYRVYGKTRYIADGAAPSGDTNDRLLSGTSGFRLDRKLDTGDAFTLQGDVFGLGADTTVYRSGVVLPEVALGTRKDDYVATGANLLARFTHQVAPHNEQRLQIYSTVDYRDEYQLSAELYTLDVDYQQSIGLRDNVDSFIYGLGGRLHFDTTESGTGVRVDPEQRLYGLSSAFAQYEWAAVPDRFYVTLGSKLEWISLGTTTLQPNLRLRWSPDEHNTVWASVSRAYRSASRAEQDGIYDNAAVGPGGVPINVVLGPNGRLNPERLTAYEVGYRVSPVKQLSIDVTAFYGVNRAIYESIPGTPAFDPASGTIRAQVGYRNGGELDVYGAEIAARAEVSRDWVVSTSYSFMDHVVVDSITDSDNFRNNDPQHQFTLVSTYRVTPRLDLNAALYVVDSIERLDGYSRLDLNVVFRPRENCEIQIGVQNTLDDRHFEVDPTAIGVAPTETETAVYARLTYRF
jgi:iron complex outermembrane recepter protein